jgi:hypothetical protein
MAIQTKMIPIVICSSCRIGAAIADYVVGSGSFSVGMSLILLIPISIMSTRRAAPSNTRWR